MRTKQLKGYAISNKHENLTFRLKTYSDFTSTSYYKLLHTCVKPWNTDQWTWHAFHRISMTLQVLVFRWLCSESAPSCWSSDAVDLARHQRLCPLQQYDTPASKLDTILVLGLKDKICGLGCHVWPWPYATWPWLWYMSLTLSLSFALSLIIGCIRCRRLHHTTLRIIVSFYF